MVLFEREDSLSSSLIYQIVYVNVTWCMLYLKLIQAKDERASLYGCEKGTGKLNIAVLVETVSVYCYLGALQHSNEFIIQKPITITRRVYINPNSYISKDHHTTHQQAKR
jgi:hypothetical protein